MKIMICYQSFYLIITLSCIYISFPIVPVLPNYDFANLHVQKKLIYKPWISYVLFMILQVLGDTRILFGISFTPENFLVRQTQEKI